MDVVRALLEAGRKYAPELIAENQRRYEAARKAMAAAGSTIVQMSADDRQKWVQALPNIAKDWAAGLEAKGVPANEVLRAYMSELRKAGEKPARNWDQ